MVYQPFSLMGNLRFGHVYCVRWCLGGTYPHHLLLPVNSINLGCCLHQASLFGSIQGPGLLSISISEVSTLLPWRHFFLVHLWRYLFFEVTCFLALLCRAWFSLSLSEHHICREGSWPCELLSNGLIVFTGCVSSPSLFNLFLGYWLDWPKMLAEISRIYSTYVGISSNRHTGYISWRSC